MATIVFIVIFIVVFLIIVRQVGRLQPKPTTTTAEYNVVILATAPQVGQAAVPLKVVFRGMPLKDALREARRASRNGHAAVTCKGRVVSAWCRQVHRGGLF